MSVDLARREELLAPSAAARLLGISTNRLRQLADGGHITPTRTPLGRLFRRADVERLAAERAARAEAKP